MKRLVIFGVLIFLLLVNGINAADYYVRPIGGNYGTENGSSYANAWGSFSSINWTKVDEGNGKLFICGTHRQTLIINESGEDGAPIQIVSCTLANGAILTKGLIA